MKKTISLSLGSILIFIIIGGCFWSFINFSYLNLYSLLFFLALFTVLIWTIPRWQVKKYSNTDTSLGQLEDAFRRTIAQILGGVLLFAGLYSSWNSFDLSRKNFELSQKRNAVDIFSRAIDQLGQVDNSGRPKLETRLGGIYTLIQLSKTSDEYYEPIISIFSADIRDNCSLSGNTSDMATQSLPREDIQAMLNAIGKLQDLGHNILPYLFLENLNLSGYNLKHLSFNHAFFSGTNLSKSSLLNTKFVYSMLERVSLQGADLSGIHFLYGSLHDASLKGAKLHGTTFEATNLEGIDFTGAILKKVHFYHVDLTKTAGLTCEQISDSVIEESKLPEALISCRGKQGDTSLNTNKKYIN